MPAMSPFVTDPNESPMSAPPRMSAVSPFSATPPSPSPAATSRGAVGGAAPSSPWGGPAPGINQERLTGLNQDLQGAAQRYAGGRFNQHWNDLTSKIDTGSNQAVEDFAKQYGVSRGQVGMNGQYHTMTNDELLAAARSKYQPTWQQTTLMKDPTYQSILAGTHPSVAGQEAQRLGMSPFDVGRDAAGVTEAQNTAAAVPVYAQAAADTGQGNQMRGQAALTAADSRAKNVDPFLGQAYQGQAAESNANAQHINAMTPFDTQREAAETAAIPVMAQNANSQRQLDTQLKQSQVARNNAQAKRDSDPYGFGGADDATPPAPTAKPAPQQRAAAAPREGDEGKSKSGRDIVFRNGKWMYKP